MAKKIDYFNTMTGLIFAQLYEALPTPADIDAKAIADKMGVSSTKNADFDWADVWDFDCLPTGEPFYVVLQDTLDWFRQEGFIRVEGQRADCSAILTAQALATMNAIPSGLSQKIGDKLVDAAKDVATETGKSAIASTVGEILGGFTKGMLGGG